MKPTDSVFSLNETLQSIENRRSIRLFTKQEVSDDDINFLPQAGNEAPSAHNQQSWRFIVMRNQKRQELARLVTSSHGPQKQPLEMKVRYLDQ